MATVDVEFVGNCRREVPPETIRRELEVWLGVVERELGRSVVIYTTPDADQAMLGGLERTRWVRSLPGEPAAPWFFWQFDPSGRVPGIEGPVDLDVVRGTRAELDAL